MMKWIRSGNGYRDLYKLKTQSSAKLVISQMNFAIPKYLKIVYAFYLMLHIDLNLCFCTTCKFVSTLISPLRGLIGPFVLIRQRQH